MVKQGKIFLRISSLLILVLILLAWYKEYGINKDKETVLTQLEVYKLQHNNYPAEIEELHTNTKLKFIYRPDSTKQSFSLTYSSGIMDVNNNTYDSKTKQWTQVFNF